MFLLVSVRHVGAHPDELQHGVSIQSSINLGKTCPRISRIRIIPQTQILAKVFVYLPPFISQILDFICRMVLILIYFEQRNTENQEYNPKLAQVSLFASLCMPTINKRPIKCYDVGTDYNAPLKDVTYTIIKLEKIC